MPAARGFTFGSNVDLIRYVVTGARGGNALRAFSFPAAAFGRPFCVSGPTRNAMSLDFDRPRVGYVLALLLASLGTIAAMQKSIEGLQSDAKNATERLTAEVGDLRAWRISAEQAMRNCKP